MNTTLVYWLPDAPSIIQQRILSIGASIRDVVICNRCAGEVAK